jgi:predicted transcriptional regulator
MDESKGRHLNLDIVADILRLLRLGYASKVEITGASQISREQAASYLERLVEAGILENAEEKMGLPAYRITRKGLALLNKIENLRELLPADKGVDIFSSSKIIEVNVGHLFATRGVAQLARENKHFADFVEKSLGRYRKGDWGEINNEDKRLNYQGEERGLLLLASYESPGFPEILIMTVPGREYTTIMFPEEYASVLPPEPYPLANAFVPPQKRSLN